MRLATWIAVLVYVGSALVLAWRARGGTEDGEAYWTAGRSLGAGGVGFSISAGFMSVSWACVYATQLFYWYGLGGAWLVTIPWLIELLGIYWLAKRYRALPAFSQPEMVGQRFSPHTRRVVALAIAIVFLAWGGAEIFVAAALLAPGLGIGETTAIIGISVVVGVYATLGGLQAVVLTDRLQYVLVGLFVLVVAGLAGWGMWGETQQLWPDASVKGHFSGTSWTDLLAPGLGLIALTFLTYIPAGLFETDLWVRVQAARDVRAARRGMLIASANAVVFVGVLPAFIGITALALFPADGAGAPAVLGTDGDAIFTALVNQYAPTWLVAGVALGLVAAAMSTIDTCINVVALSVGYDLLRMKERASSTRAAQWVTLGVTVGTCFYALASESLWDIFFFSGGILTSAVAFPVAAVFWRKASAQGVTASAWFGLVGVIVAYYAEQAGLLSFIQPTWIDETGIGYILWGVGAAMAGYLLGLATDHYGTRGAQEPA